MSSQQLQKLNYWKEKDKRDASPAHGGTLLVLSVGRN